MNQFVLAFPLPVAADEAFAVTETLQIAADAKTVMIPGCSVQFNVVRHPAAAGLSEIFKEHNELTAEETAAIDAHKSLLFLLGNVKSAEDLRMVNVAILKLLTAGAKGVYMQHSGAAWSADAFREELGDAEFPMDPWLNFVESADTLYTLGLEVFGLPDLCIGLAGGTPEEIRNILSVTADTLFVDDVSSKSGTDVDAGDAGFYVLRQELKIPFAKDAPEFNKQGIMRLIKK